jgi:hypothetical protein
MSPRLFSLRESLDVMCGALTDRRTSFFVPNTHPRHHRRLGCGSPLMVSGNSGSRLADRLGYVAPEVLN